MTLAATSDLVAEAVTALTAVPAFNVLALEQVEAVAAGGDEARVPVLMQVSENAIAYHGAFAPLFAACREVAGATGIPIGLHADHIRTPELVDAILTRCDELGIGSIMVDGSQLPYDENVAWTADVVRRARQRGLWVEAELGEIGGKDGAHASGARTDPDEAAAFVAATGVDGLAVAVGSSHAMRSPSAVLDEDLIRTIAGRVDVPLVLHGSSGVPEDGIARAVASGIRKVNIGTALNVVATAQLRADLAARPDAVDPRRYLTGGRERTRELVAHLARVVGRRTFDAAALSAGENHA